MSHDFGRELDVAIEAVRTAAGVCRSVQATVTPESLAKKDRSPVTVADFASQAVICRALEAAFPDDPVIAEEDSRDLARPENVRFVSQIRDELRQAGIDAGDSEIFRWIDRGGTAEYVRRFWTLDPIDGTKGFLRGEQYALSLALIVDGRIEVAVLGCPNLDPQPNAAPPLTEGGPGGVESLQASGPSNGGDERSSSAGGESLSASGPPPAPPYEGGERGAIFYAVRGEGSWALPLAAEQSRAVPVRSGPARPGSLTRIHVSETADAARARFCESVESGHSAHHLSAKVAEILGIGENPLRMDSQAKYAAVARGEADIYMRLPTRAGYVEKIWDHAGGVLIVEEAGGTVTDVAGRKLEWTHGRELSANRGVVAANPHLHGRVISVLRELGASGNDECRMTNDE